MTAPTFSWLVQTKLRPPLARADTISRARLLSRLQGAVAAHPLTLISAPAGAGKTTLLTSWLAALAEPTAAGARFDLAPASVAWLSLDAQDDDPALFLAALIAALRRIAPSCGEQVQAALASGVDPRADLVPLVGLLLNELDAQLAAPAALVLDDLHAIADPAIYRALEYLAERLPPQLRLLLATRDDPPIGLPRLRARRQLAELRLAELRFTAAEAHRLLLGAGGGAVVSEAQVLAIWQRTEGWAAGISLLAGSLERIESQAERERLLAGLQRTERAVFDYLAEEVLERQDPFVRMFLLETAILPELTPAACTAVTGRDDAAAVLDTLYRRNLFLVALDSPEAEATYRYHDLFASFLREQLRREHPAWLRDLHRRAARHATGLGQRVQHLLAAGLPEEACGEVESAGDDLIRRGAIATLRQLIESLPAEARAARPRLDGLYGMSLAQLWDNAAARPWLERAVRAFHAQGDSARHSEALAYLADTLRMLGDYPAARAADAALRSAGLPEATAARRLLSHAWQSLADGDAAGAAAALGQLVSLLEQHGESSALYPVATGFHVPFLMLPGGVALAERFCRVLAAADQQSGSLQVAAGAIAAWCALLRGQVGAAEAQATEVVARADQLGGLPWVDMDVALIPWLCAGLRGDMARARAGAAAFLARLDMARNSPGEAWRPLYLALLARLAWLHGDDRHFREALALLRAAKPTDWPASPGMRALIQGLAAANDGDEAAEDLLRAAVGQQVRHVEGRLAGDARVALAHLYAHRGRTDDALAAFAPALADCARERCPGFLCLEGASVVAPLLELAVARGVHANFAEQTLVLLERVPSGGRQAQSETYAAASSPAPSTLNPQRPALPEPLTPREVEVLGLLAAGASNQAIADTLVISLHTVKRHVTNILQKLDATSRLDAVARARAIGLMA
jgi:LuxR family transcriptional regulator, maltose regulon positive regulatory protein